MTVALAASAVAILCFVSLRIVQELRSPLRSIPCAHWSARWCSLWITWVRWRHAENAEVYAAHVRLGSVVRLGVNELSVDCVDDGIRAIYGGGFEKGEWYKRFNYFGAKNMFSTVDSVGHSWRKRLISHDFSKSAILSSPAFFRNVTETLQRDMVPLLDRASRTGVALDMKQLTTALTIDLVTAFLFGPDSRASMCRNKALYQDIMGAYRDRKRALFFMDQSPTLVQLLGYSGLVPNFRRALLGIACLEDWCMSMCQAASISPTCEPSSGAIWRKLNDSVAGTAKPGCHSLQLLEAASEMFDHVSAGHQTSTVVITYLVFHLSQDAALQQELRAELVALGTTPDIRGLDALPLLAALIQETMRRYPPIAGAQPRITPHGVNTRLGKMHEVPGGVTVSASAYALHRNPAVFPDPLEWRPKRWLHGGGPGEEDRLKEMHRWMWAFGSGGRMCIGKNVALLQIKLVVAAIYRAFETRLKDERISMSPKDGYSGETEAAELLTLFRPAVAVDERAA